MIQSLEDDALAALRVLDLAGLFHAVRSRCAWAWWDAKKADEELAEKRRVEAAQIRAESLHDQEPSGWKVLDLTHGGLPPIPQQTSNTTIK
jgi:hypothetical protein